MLETILAKLKSEPLRVRAYTVAALVIGFLSIKGYISLDDADFYVTLAGLLLAVEGSRRKVSPVDA